MDHTAEKSLGWRVPLEVLLGQTVDISPMVVFTFWDPVYVACYHHEGYHGQIGAECTNEIRGRMVGFSRDTGHALTFKILTDDTKRIIYRSQVRLARDADRNLKLDTQSDAVPERVYIRSKRDDEGDDLVMPTIDMTSNPFTVDGEPAKLPHQETESPDE